MMCDMIIKISNVEHVRDSRVTNRGENRYLEKQGQTPDSQGHRQVENDLVVSVMQDTSHEKIHLFLGVKICSCHH